MTMGASRAAAMGSVSQGTAGFVAAAEHAGAEMLRAWYACEGRQRCGDGMAGGDVGYDQL